MNDHQQDTGHEVLDELTAGEIRNIVFSDNSTVQERFKELCGSEIEKAVLALAEAHAAFQELQPTVVLDERTGTVQFFIHVAINSILCSLHHLVSGYPIAAGNLMRHFTESLAMALMCADEKTGVYQVYAQDLANYPIQKAPKRLRKKEIKRVLQESMKFDSEGWEGLLKIARLYDQLSHVSGVTLAHQLMFGEDGGLVIGAEFDPKKKEQYLSDVVRRRSAAESLAHIIPIIMGVLPSEPPDEAI